MNTLECPKCGRVAVGSQDPVIDEEALATLCDMVIDACGDRDGKQIVACILFTVRREKANAEYRESSEWYQRTLAERTSTPVEDV